MNKTIFQQIINKEIPSKIYYEDDVVISIYDINPRRPGHILVIPKKLSINLIDIDDNTFSYLMLKAKELAIKLIKEMNVSGFNFIVNNGKNAKQEVFHTHIHIIPSLV